MHRLLFVLPAFRYGGTMTSFENLLMLLNKEDYEIDVYAIVDEGESRDRIAKNANIINKDRKTHADQKSSRFSFRHIAKRVKDVLAKMGFDLGPYYIRKMAQRFNSDKYDAVIAYQEGYPTTFVANVKAKYKIAWIHSMYSRWGNGSVAKEYDKMNSIVCVSETAKQDMLALYHNNTNRIQVIKNSLNKEEIIRLSKIDILHKSDCFHIISVGRIDPVKRFSRIPVIAKELRAKGQKFKWSIVGGVADQKEYETIVRRIRENGLEDIVSLEGQMSNPYPAIRNSDLLVCLSSSETFNYTLTEARILGVPVVSSNFSAAMEFVNNGKDGMICPIEKMADTIYNLIANFDCYQRQKDAIREYHYDNNIVIKSFNNMMSSI